MFKTDFLEPLYREEVLRKYIKAVKGTISKTTVPKTRLAIIRVFIDDDHKKNACQMLMEMKDQPGTPAPNVQNEYNVSEVIKWIKEMGYKISFELYPGQLPQKQDKRFWMVPNIVPQSDPAISFKLMEVESKNKSILKFQQGIFGLLPSYSKIFANTILPITHAIYFLLKDNEVVYVGQTNCLFSRVGTHIKEGRILFDSWSYLATPEERLNQIEQNWITLLQPKYNKTHTNVNLSLTERLGKISHT